MAGVVQSGGYALDTAGTGQDGAPHIVLPNPPTNGNLLVYVYCTFGAQPSTPAGWTLKFWENAGGDSIGLYYRTAGAGETASVPFIPSGNTNNGSISLFEVEGWLSVGSAGHTTGGGGSTSYTLSSARVTTSWTDTLVLQVWHNRDTGGNNPATHATIGNSFTQEFSAPETRFGGGRAVVGGSRIFSASGVNVDPTATFPNTQNDRLAIANLQIEIQASVDVTANGDLPDAIVDAMTGTADTFTDVTADGVIPNIRVAHPTGTAAAGDIVAAGDLGEVMVDAPGGAATGPDVAFASQAYLEAIGRVVPQVQVSQTYLEAIAAVVPPMSVSQAFLEVLANSIPCVTAWAQCWRIERRDGQVFCFTSLDQDLTWKGEPYLSCNSLDPSASESASTLGSVGNIELEGIIASEAITEGDLYGGLYDDAFVEVWLVPWDEGTTEVPKRIAAGWTGALSQGESGFKMEVLGPGARLGQQALVQSFTPTCRRVFGSPQTDLPPGGCGVDIEALAITGTVLSALERGSFVADLSSESTGSQWANGRVRWTAGANVGQVCEVKEVDFATGLVTLWALAAYVPEYGDAFDLLPGCDLIKTGGCTVYNNVINFGGFDAVPGQDSLLETPDAQY